MQLKHIALVTEAVTHEAVTGASLGVAAASSSKADSWRSQIESHKTQFAPA